MHANEAGVDRSVVPCWIFPTGAKADNASCDGEAPEEADDRYSVSSSPQNTAKYYHRSRDNDSCFPADIIARQSNCDLTYTCI